MDTNTAPAVSKQAKELALKELELTGEESSRASQTFYKAETDEEKALDKRVNLKLDFTVVAILAVQFIVCFPCTESYRKVDHH